MQNYINGLLENPMFNLGVGLLNASGPRPVTSGFGNVLAQGVGYATDRQSAVMRNQAYRDQLAASKRQQEARGLLAQQFQGVPGGGLIGNLFDAGYGQEAIGLLTQPGVKPEAAYQTYVAMGGDPSDMAAYAQFRRSQDPSAEVQAALQLQQLRDREAETTRATEERNVSLGNQRVGWENRLDDAVKMYDLIGRLEGTLLEPGTPGVEGIKTALSVEDAVRDFFGGDDSRQNRQLIADFNEFNKLASGFTVESFGEFTNIPRAQATMDLVAQSQPGINIDGIANRRILARLIDRMADSATVFNDAYPQFKIRNIEDARDHFAGIDIDTGQRMVRIEDMK